MNSYAYAGLIVSVLVFFLTLFFLFRESLSNPLEFKLASRRGKIMVSLVIFTFLTIVSSTTYITLEKIRNDVEESLTESLATVLETTHESIRIWATDKKISLQRAARDPRLTSITQSLIQAYQHNENLLEHSAQIDAREHFKELAGSDRTIGFFIVSVNGINLASMRDSNVATINPILLHRPELFARVLNGESVMVHAIPSDVSIKGSQLIKGMDVPPTMFIATPIFSDENKLIAVFAERYDPAAGFSDMLSLGRLGVSGETYAFNEQAQLISASRFTDDYIAEGEMKSTEQSILSIRLTVPPKGGNSTAGAERFTKMAASALRKQAGINVQGYPDYRGIDVVGAWTWDDNLEIGITTEQNYIEAFASYESAKLLILALLISTSFIAIGYTGVILLLGNRATKYLEALANDLEENVAQRNYELRKSERLLQLVIDTVPAPIYMKDINGRYELINSEFEKVVDVKRDQTIGKTDTDIMSVEVGQSLAERDLEIMKAGQAVILSEQAALPDGSMLYFQSYKNPIVDGNGQVVGLTGVAFDVTDREATAKALTDTLQSLSFVQYVVDDAAYMVVWADTETGLLEFGNRAAEAFLKINAQKLLTLHAYEIDNQISQDNYAQFIDENRRQPKTYETEVCAHDGSCRAVELTSQVIQFGEKERLVIFARDISEAKSLQNELIDAKIKAEEGSLAKSEFLASMSHEIRTPLNGVLGMIGLVRKSELSSDQDEKLRIAQSSATSLLGIINDLLDFSKIEAHKMEVEALDFNIVELLNDVVQSMDFKAEEKGIALILETDAVTRTNIKSDPTRIRQILVNLIGNAIKFTSEGEVRIVASLTESEQDDLRFTCHVIDTGVGIAEAKISGLFDKFSQADSTVTRKYGGTGLGLAISQKLCDLLNGTIQVESELGKGSDFNFTIEVAESNEVVRQLPQVSVSGTRILIVDDIEINRVIFRSQVESWGASVHEATHGDQALTMLNAQEEGFYDFLLLDMNMPRMSGLELASFIRANHKWQNIRIIMMTSTTERAASGTLLEHGINGYFSKPVKPMDLHNAIKVLSVHGQELADAGIVVSRHYLESLSRANDANEIETTAVINTQLKILLVEDNEINQLIAKGLLENLNLGCHTVNDGQQAIDYLHSLTDSEHLDLILMDCQMPVLDGYAATEKIRQGEAGEWARHVPIVAMTAHALAGDKEKCLACGMNDFITKPIDEQDFKRVLLRYSEKISEVEKLSLKNSATETVTETNMPRATASVVGELRLPSGLATIDAENPPTFAKFASAYLSAIGVLVQQSSQIKTDMQAAFNSEAFDELRNLAHALKGSSANLGFDQLSAYCAEVELTIREHNQCGSVQVSQLIEQLDLCAQDAQAVIEHNKQAETASPDWQELKEVIMNLLAESQVVGAEHIHDLANVALSHSKRQQIEQVVESLNNFEYDEALQQLKNL